MFVASAQGFIMLYATHSAALWLLFLVYFVSPIIAPCTICFGAGVPDGCTGDSNTCPWGTAIAANVAAISAGLGGTLTVARVLPSKITRFLSKSILDSISALASRVSILCTFFVLPYLFWDREGCLRRKPRWCLLVLVRPGRNLGGL